MHQKSLLLNSGICFAAFQEVLWTTDIKIWAHDWPTDWLRAYQPTIQLAYMSNALILVLLLFWLLLSMSWYFQIPTLLLYCLTYFHKLFNQQYLAERHQYYLKTIAIGTDTTGLSLGCIGSPREVYSSINLDRDVLLRLEKYTHIHEKKNAEKWEDSFIYKSHEMSKIYHKFTLFSKIVKFKANFGIRLMKFGFFCTIFLTFWKYDPCLYQF